MKALRHPTPMTRILAALLIGLVAGIAQAQGPANLVKWRAGLTSAGQPDVDWLERVHESKYDVVVNLAPPQVQGSIASEGGIVAKTGVYYVNIPVDFRKPTAEDFRFFSEVMRANAGRNVFVHCQVNLRGSSFVFLYRVIHENADPREALAKLTGVWSPDPVWKRFIEETLAAHGKKVEIL
jgi:protein tyrosine phosphatase (PTP) superfamily phosphohydrolase (DUF442 family)